VIFYSENADRMTFGLHRRLNEAAAGIEYKKVEVGGHNALDFQLATYLGWLIAQNPHESYCIVSNDRALSGWSSFWKAPKYDVRVAAEIAVRPAAAAPLALPAPAPRTGAARRQAAAARGQTGPACRSAACRQGSRSPRPNRPSRTVPIPLAAAQPAAKPVLAGCGYSRPAGQARLSAEDAAAVHELMGSTRPRPASTTPWSRNSAAPAPSSCTIWSRKTSLAARQGGRRAARKKAGAKPETPAK
jgi:hypothetical protein